jgi:hypothetical protein
MQDLPQQRALGHRVPVDAVVRGHHRPRAALVDDRVEGREIELAQRPLVHPRIERHALGLAVVGDEVLDRRADAAGLHAACVRDPDASGEERVLAEALEVAAAVRRAVQVHGRGEQHVGALAARLVGQQPAEPLDQRLVPRRRQRGRRRNVGRRVALVPGLAADAGRPVGDHQAPQAHGGLGVQRPEVRAGQEPHLLLE